MSTFKPYVHTVAGKVPDAYTLHIEVDHVDAAGVFVDVRVAYYVGANRWTDCPERAKRMTCRGAHRVLSRLTRNNPETLVASAGLMPADAGLRPVRLAVCVDAAA